MNNREIDLVDINKFYIHYNEVLDLQDVMSQLNITSCEHTEEITCPYCGHVYSDSDSF